MCVFLCVCLCVCVCVFECGFGGVCVFGCVCISFHCMNWHAKRGKYILKLNKNLKKNTLIYKCTDGHYPRKLKLNICALNILNNMNFYIQNWQSIPNFLPGWNMYTNIYFNPLGCLHKFMEKITRIRLHKLYSLPEDEN